MQSSDLPSFKLIGVLVIAIGLWAIGGCKEFRKDSASQSIEALESGDNTQRYQGPCGAGDVNWENESPETALKRVFNAAPEYFTNLYGGSPENHIELVDDIACVCGSKGTALQSTNTAVESCWGEPGRVERCKGVQTASLRLFDEGLGDQKAPMKIYMARSTKAIHRQLLSTMVYALLDGTAPDDESCRKAEKLLEAGIEKAQSNDEYKNHLATLQEELTRIKAECRNLNQEFSQLRKKFAKSVLLADGSLKSEGQSFDALFKAYSVQTLEEAVEHPGVQTFLIAESIDSFYCSKETNLSLRNYLPAAWLTISKEGFGNPVHFTVDAFQNDG